MYVCTSAVLAAAALAGVSAVPAFATGGGGPVAQSVLGSGSDTTQLMMNSIDRVYQFSPGCQQLAPTGTTQWLDFSCLSPDPSGTITTENYQHDQLAEATFLGSSNGISQLCSQGQAGVAHIDFARSSRGPKTPDSCTGMHFVAYARDAISWEAFNLGPATGNPNGSGIHNMNNQTGTCAGSGGTTQFCLTQTQLQGIFITCSIKNWSAVGGQNVPIQIYTPQAGSGTRSTWDKFLGGDSSHCIPASQLATHVVPENANTLITKKYGAIFPFSYGVWSTQVKGRGGAVLGAVDDVAVTVSTIQDGSFPFGRFLYNVYCSSSCSSGASSTAAVNYVGEEGWICKPNSSHAADPTTGVNYTTEIQSAISSNGFVPLPSGVIGGGDPNSDYCRLFTT
jgi:ABC-type phosphate transport system substrate-binding protein